MPDLWQNFLGTLCTILIYKFISFRCGVFLRICHLPEITTVEGVIDRAAAGLKQDQPLRRTQDPTAAALIEGFLTKLQNLKSVKKPFTMVYWCFN